MWLLDCESKPEENIATQAVVDVVLKEHIRLEALSMTPREDDAEKHSETFGVITEKLHNMDPDFFEAKACELLHGLGIT